MRPGRAGTKELYKIIQCTDVSLETKAKIIHALVFLITMDGFGSWTVKEAGQEEKLCVWNVVLEESFVDVWDCPHGAMSDYLSPSIKKRLVGSDLFNIYFLKRNVLL